MGCRLPGRLLLVILYAQAGLACIDFCESTLLLKMVWVRSPEDACRLTIEFVKCVKTCNGTAASPAIYDQLKRSLSSTGLQCDFGNRQPVTTLSTTTTFTATSKFITTFKSSNYTTGVTRNASIIVPDISTAVTLTDCRCVVGQCAGARQCSEVFTKSIFETLTQDRTICSIVKDFKVCARKTCNDMLPLYDVLQGMEELLLLMSACALGDNQVILLTRYAEALPCEIEVCQTTFQRDLNRATDAEGICRSLSYVHKCYHQSCTGVQLPYYVGQAVDVLQHLTSVCNKFSTGHPGENCNGDISCHVAQESLAAMPTLCISDVVLVCFLLVLRNALI